MSKEKVTVIKRILAFALTLAMMLSVWVTPVGAFDFGATFWFYEATDFDFDPDTGEVKLDVDYSINMDNTDNFDFDDHVESIEVYYMEAGDDPSVDSEIIKTNLETSLIGLEGFDPGYLGETIDVWVKIVGTTNLVMDGNGSGFVKSEFIQLGASATGVEIIRTLEDTDFDVSAKGIVTFKDHIDADKAGDLEVGYRPKGSGSPPDWANFPTAEDDYEVFIRLGGTPTGYRTSSASLEVGEFTIAYSVLTEDDFIRLIKANLIFKDGDDYKFTFSVFTKEQFDVFKEYFDKDNAELDETLVELITDIHKSFKAFVPKRLDSQINQWVSCYVHNIIGFIAEELINRNVLEKPDDEKPLTNGVFYILGKYLNV